ncbi:1,4-beta-xylanase [Xylanibacillus composti]|uniref:Beta-xylanase n=1 Tax=Xylanibacillus composti TaxID=1572762 RepID=A0A8J4H6I9_9BACL|nr:endo-1,4-beta-xylanase [Xylanibacillus composti]MDT9726135.1 1,4-beta-xylanase [Xylanibacillus composti]GIQ70630.1 hypothetical protein XYCOK13_34540 [Xylanibacillus composti]
MSNKLRRAVSILLAAALLIPSAWFAPAVQAETESPEGELILSESFEEGQGNWHGNGAAEVSVTTDVYRTGERSLLVAGRSQDYHGPSLPLTDTLESGATYQISGYVRLAPDAAEDAQIKMSMEQIGDTITDNNEKYKQIVGLQAVTKDDWVQLSGSYTYNPEAASIKLYFESDSARVSFALDDVTIYKTADAPSEEFEPVEIGAYDFEDGELQGWGPRGGGVAVEAVTETAQSGTYSLKVTGRTADWQGVSIDLKDVLKKGAKYQISGYVKLVEDEEASNMKFSVEQINGESYVQVNDPVEVTDAEWVKLEGTYTFDTDYPLQNLYVEGSKLSSFYLDNVTIVQTSAVPGEETPRDPALPFTTITFEDRTSGGVEGRGGTEILTVTDEANHTEDGSYALKVEGRSETWHGPSLRVEKYVDLGYEYRVSVWVKLIEPTSTTLQLSTQVGHSDSGASYNNITSRTVSASDGWVQLEGTYRYTSAGGEHLTIYVEASSNANASFYIDDISFEPTGSGPVDIERDLLPIKDAYQDDFLIGNAVSAADLEGVRLELLKMHHNVATAENAMKPDQVYNADREFDFAAEDELVDKVLAEGLQMFGHVLVWHQQSPLWLHTVVDENGDPVEDEHGNTLYLDREEALQNLRTHVKTVVEHFGDRVIGWDVLNEAINDNPPTPEDWRSALRQSGWYRAIGPDYVEEAFLAAREVLDDHPEWDVKLYYNDYNDDNQNKARAIYHMVKELNEKYAETHPGKLLIDGIGMQAHYNVNTNPENVRLSLERFASLGVEVSITELDITAGSNNQLSEKEAIAQGYLYAQLFQIYKEHADHIARVTFWGLNDATSWRAAQSPLLFDANLRAKPAYYGVIDPDKFLAEHERDTSDAKQATARYGTPVIDGEVDAVWHAAQEIPIDQYQTAWQGASGVAKALWDARNLYVLIQVDDAELDKSNANAWEQDSIEVFLDQNNAKTTFYQADDGQYRVNFDNEASFTSPVLAEGFESATKVNGTNYTVEVKIPLTAIRPANEVKLGFDVQINDAKDGARQSVAAWNDTTGTGFQDPSVFGVLRLTGGRTSGGGSGGSGEGTDSQNGTVEQENGAVTIRPSTQTDNGRLRASISGDQLNGALEQAEADATGTKRIIIALPEEESAYDLELPAQNLLGEESFVLLIQTGSATIEVPGNMLSNLTDSHELVTIQINTAAADTLDAAIREQIGNRPAISLRVLVDGDAIAWNNPEAPVTVVIPYTPTAEELARPEHIVFWHIDSNGKVTTIQNSRYDQTAEVVTFRTTHFSTFAVTSVFKTFEDLKNVPWAQAFIETLASRDIIHGTGEDRYSPAAAMKRADFIALLVRALDLQSSGKDVAMFVDVPATAYYYEELRIAKELGIVIDQEADRFQPNAAISRQDAMLLTVRALEAAGKSVAAGGSLHSFADAADVSDYAVDSVAALVHAGIIVGKNGKIDPHASINRAETAVILYRVWER